jgi:hypothetical protein
MVEIKGSAIVDSIKAVKLRSGDEAYGKILAALSQETRNFFEKTIILSSNWYPLDAFVQFLEADIKLTANGNEKELIGRSEAIIEKQLRGIYKMAVKLGSPEFVINRIATTHEAYFKGVSIEASMVNPTKAKVKYTGFNKQHYLIGFSIIGFYKKALEISGAKNVNAVYITSIEQNIGYCELEITWTNK